MNFDTELGIEVILIHLITRSLLLLLVDIFVVIQFKLKVLVTGYGYTFI